MKKAQALSVAARLLVILIFLAVMIVILIKSGIISNLYTIIATTLTTWGSFIRGITVKFVWYFAWALIGLFTLILVIFGSTCRAFPVGTAICAAMYATFLALVMHSVFSLFTSIPLLELQNPTIKVGDFNVSCGESKTSNITFLKEVADRTVDCWKMYTAGKLNPLTGKTPPNPRTCFIINFNLKDSVTIEEMVNYLKTHEYPTGKKCGGGYTCKITYWGVLASYEGDPARIAIMRTNSYIYYLDYWHGEQKDDSWYKKPLKKGRLFIKYYDDHFLKKIGDSDCYTDWDVMHDIVFWCFDEDVTCDENCNLLMDTSGITHVCAKSALMAKAGEAYGLANKIKATFGDSCTSTECPGCQEVPPPKPFLALYYKFYNCGSSDCTADCCVSASDVDIPCP